MKITRRMVLAATAGLAASASVGAGALLARWWDRAPGEGLHTLSQDEHDFAQAVAEAWMPPGGDPPLSGADAALGGFLDGVVSAMEPATARELKLLLQVLDDFTLPTHLSSFRKLPLESRTEVLHGWLHSDQPLMRGAIQAVLVLLSVGWTTHPDVVGRLQPLFPCGYGR